MRRVLSFGAAITALVLLISACSGGGAPTSTPAPLPSLTATPALTPTATPAPTPTATPAPIPTATLPQRLRANLGAEPNSLDPQMASTLIEFSVIRHVFQGLLGFGPDLSLEPVVAAEVPTVESGGISQDGLTYTFKLRDDVTWSDGQRVTAADFEFAVKRLLDPETAARNAFLYAAIKGAMEYNSAGEADASSRQALRDAVGVEAVDDYTLRVTLVMPNPTFLQKMALVHVYPVRQDVIERFGTKLDRGRQLPG